MSQIKINRAMRLSVIGDCPGSFASMLDAIPAEVRAALTSHQLAEQIDANWRLASASKALSERGVTENGFVWDSSAERGREIA